MHKAILKKFVLVLLAALCINSFIFYMASSHIILNESRRDMQYTIRILDGVLNFEGDLSGQMQRLKEFTADDKGRITLIAGDGRVVADSDADAEKLDNHQDRQEVKDAILTGEGYARRYSATLDETMLYVARRSDYSDMILRMAIPYSGMRDYLPLLFPAAVASFLAAFIFAFIVTSRFADSVTRPLGDISKEMLKVKGDYSELHFEKCPYPEINVIVETTMKMSENVKEYLNRIEKEKQIRQEFFSNASHELKTPITSIQGYAELLESGMITNEEMKLDFARRIKKEAVNMTGLINDILQISRLESKDAAQTAMSEVRMNLLLEEIADSVKPLYASCQVYLHVDCQPICITANPQQMKELVSNLLTNAAKYNRPGGQVWLTLQQSDGNMVLRVRDNGVGIPQESLERIFERFYRVDKGRSRKQGGTGLGLSIVKHIVNFYHGTIRVTSTLEQGSEFIVSIPISAPKSFQNEEKQDCIEKNTL